MKDIARVEELLNDLAEGEMLALADLVGGLDRLAMEDGSPKYTGEEIDLIGRFADVPQAEDDDDEDEGIEDADHVSKNFDGVLVKSDPERDQQL